MSVAGPIMQFTSGLIQAYGSIQSGEGQAKAYEFNAEQADQNAKAVLFQTAQQERQARIDARRQLGEMRTGYGASGVNMEGSPMAVLAESAAAAEMDALNIKYGGQVKATNFANQAKINRYMAGQSRSAGYYGAAASLMGGAGGAAKMFPMGGSGGGGSSSSGGWEGSWSGSGSPMSGSYA